MFLFGGSWFTKLEPDILLPVEQKPLLPLDLVTQVCQHSILQHHPETATAQTSEDFWSAPQSKMCFSFRASLFASCHITCSEEHGVDTAPATWQTYADVADAV